jgi:hypothetical protein
VEVVAAEREGEEREEGRLSVRRRNSGDDARSAKRKATEEMMPLPILSLRSFVPLERFFPSHRRPERG